MPIGIDSVSTTLTWRARSRGAMFWKFCPCSLTSPQAEPVCRPMFASAWICLRRSVRADRPIHLHGDGDSGRWRWSLVPLICVADLKRVGAEQVGLCGLASGLIIGSSEEAFQLTLFDERCDNHRCAKERGDGIEW